MRGALMLSISCRHPESDAFISAKLEQGKVTGANISIKFDDEFMECVKNDSDYCQYFPIHGDKNEIIPFDLEDYEPDVIHEGKKEGTFFKIIKARKLWDKVIYNAWRSAEPGTLFWDQILTNTPTRPYFDKGFKPVSTNPCFTGDTEVVTKDYPDGIRIDKLAMIGDPFNVHSAGLYGTEKDPTWIKEYKPAIAFKTGVKKVIALHLSNKGVIKCTPDHMIAMPNGTYIEAKRSVGKELVTYGPNKLYVDHIESISEPVEVYDLNVSDNHNFFITSNGAGVLVHNCGEDFAAIETSCEMLENL